MGRALSVLLGKKMKKKQLRMRMKSLKMKKKMRMVIMLKRILDPLSSKERMTFQKAAGSRSCNPSTACGPPRT